MARVTIVTWPPAVQTANKLITTSQCRGKNSTGLVSYWTIVIILCLRTHSYSVIPLFEHLPDRPCYLERHSGSFDHCIVSPCHSYYSNLPGSFVTCYGWIDGKDSHTVYTLW